VGPPLVIALTVRSRVPNIHETNGNFTKTDQETASVLCDNFGNTFVREPQLNKTIAEDDEENFHVQVAEAQVLKALHRLKPDKSPGPDNLHPMLLRETAGCITVLLTVIYRKSVEEGTVPDGWKKANITPIFKKGCN